MLDGVRDGAYLLGLPLGAIDQVDGGVTHLAGLLPNNHARVPHVRQHIAECLSDIIERARHWVEGGGPQLRPRAKVTLTHAFQMAQQPASPYSSACRSWSRSWKSLAVSSAVAA